VLVVVRTDRLVWRCSACEHRWNEPREAGGIKPNVVLVGRELVSLTIENCCATCGRLMDSRSKCRLFQACRGGSRQQCTDCCSHSGTYEKEGRTER